MAADEKAQRGKDEDVVAVLTARGGVVRSSGPLRVTCYRPCAIDSAGVTLYRWPMRSIFIPLERVDRFDVVLCEDTWTSGQGAYRANDVVERLALFTRNGETLRVSGSVIDLMSRWHGLPPGARALQLNNHLSWARRPPTPSDGEPPPPRS